MRRHGHAIVIGIVLVLYAARSVQYAAVWRDELTLWTAAVQHAPDKPRPHLALALALMERGRFQEAQAVLDDTDRLLRTRRDLPWWDRQEAETALLRNRLLLARASGAGPWR